MFVVGLIKPSLLPNPIKLFILMSIRQTTAGVSDFALLLFSPTKNLADYNTNIIQTESIWFVCFFFIATLLVNYN